MVLRLSYFFTVCLASLSLAGNAFASGGNYVFAGGSPAERANVKAALDASAFPWSFVPKRITIRIGAGFPSDAAPGTIWLDANLVDSGRLAWGTILHEYGHQVDYFMLDNAKRKQLAPLLGGKSWFPAGTLPHRDLTAERFASMLAWSYWPDPANSMKPSGPNDESSAMAPAQFRALLNHVLGVPDLVPPPAKASVTAGSNAKPKPHKAPHHKARKPRRRAPSAAARRNRR
jgi:hypothetical protein